MMRNTTKISRQADGEFNVMKCHSTIYEQTGILSTKHVRHRGVALIWSAILMMLMILLIGLSLDTAKVALVNHQLHNAADAGALAGCRIVKTEPDRAPVLAGHRSDELRGSHPRTVGPEREQRP